VIALRGEFCRSCGTVNDLQCDHVRARSQGGKSVVENGMMLCRECHRRKTERLMLIRYEWLDDDQTAWLKEVGWVWWEHGVPHGHGCNGFAERNQND